MNEIELDLMFAPEDGWDAVLDPHYGLNNGIGTLEGPAGNIELQLRSFPGDKSSDLTLSAAAQIPIILPYVTVLAAPLAAALGAWLKERYGRKVRLKVGDIEAEAGTTEEIEKLLARAQEFKQANEPKRIHER